MQPTVVLNLPCWVDSIRLSQILNKFVSNDLKLIKFGEIEIRGELPESVADGDMIRFIVKDCYIGISKEEQIKLFQKYLQGDANTV